MVKQLVLKTLREAGDFVSGQSLCTQAGVSRTAVWNSVNALREEGYVISSVTNKGYRLEQSPDLLTDAEISSRLTTDIIGRNLICLPETDSTNEELKRRSAADRKLADGTVAITGKQTLGKGRRGRSWQCKTGEAIAMSIFLRPDTEPGRASMLTIVAALAVRQACQEISGLDITIKWPNDLLIGRKKLCGILTEMSAEPDHIEYVIVGIGINVNNRDFPPEIENRATSLYRESKNASFSRAELAALVLKRFEEYYESFCSTGDLAVVTDEYNRHLAGLGETVRVLDPRKEYEGISRGINETGELLLETDKGDIGKVYAGEISIKGDWYS